MGYVEVRNGATEVEASGLEVGVGDGIGGGVVVRGQLGREGDVSG